jgi:hypothetical protein
MKNLLIILFLLPLMSLAQGRPPTGSQSIEGEIEVPALQSITVELINMAPIKFENPNDLNSSKLINGLYKITVISNIPWVVNVSSADPFFINGNASIQKMPISSIALRGINGNYIPLSTTPVSIFKNTNDKIVNVFYVDARVSAQVEFGSGKFKADLLFSISPD